ncbi:MAG: choice-of-anchor J domain-containing protein [Flavobacteriaceae bacterium]|nr:choice-of-anchor J domain-containing protein [Flavobacteriaceae bacterium]
MKRIFTSLLLIFSAVVALNAQVYYSNNFDGTPAAQGWSVFNNGIGIQQSWGIYQIGYSAPNAAAIQYENVPNGSVAEDYLATPLIDLTNAVNPRLTFMAAQSWAQNYGSMYYVLVSTTEQSNPAAYTTIASWTEPELSGAGFAFKSVDLSAYVGQQIYIAFMMANDDGDNFIIDDVVVDEAVDNNITLISLESTRYVLANQDIEFVTNVRNSGTNTITSIEYNLNDGTDHIAVMNVNIAPGATAQITHPALLNFSTTGEYTITGTITQVNGGADSYPSDNTATINVNVISQDGGKKVVFEEGTGSWCGWCPRGFVMMEYMTANFPDSFIGIAVHNGDPMAFAEYNNGAAFSGFPSMNIDRTELGANVEGNHEASIAQLNRNLYPTPVAVSASATRTGREVSIDTQATFYSDFSNSNFRFAVVIVENGVTGTSSGYAQENYYSGGAAGPMDGWENLPNPVPANQMVYDHVGRALLGGYHGVAGSVPAVIADGQTFNYSFNYTVPASFNLENVYGVVLMLDNNTGRIMNANTFPIGNLSTNEVATVKEGFTIYPNPAKDVVNLNILEAGKYQTVIYNTLGQEVARHNLSQINSSENISLPVSHLSPGVYIISLMKDGKSFSKKLIIK